MIYFDNAATTFSKSNALVKCVTECITDMSFNPHRSNHPLAYKLASTIADTRQAFAEVLGVNDSANVTFCAGCTAALNTAILGSLNQFDHVVTTVCEHNSVLRPIYYLSTHRNVKVSVLVPDKDGTINPRTLDEAITSKTKLVVINHISNVTGYTQNLAQLSEITRKHNVQLLVDCAQSFAYTQINMLEDGIDMVALPLHKGLHALPGCGVLAYNGTMPQPLTYGGTGSVSNSLVQPDFSPDAMESGTQNTPAIVSSLVALKELKQDFNARREKVRFLQRYITEGLHRIDKVKIFSVPNDSGIVSFSLGMDSNSVADALAENYDIVARGGLHCAPLIHKYLNTEQTGLVRISASFTNTQSDADVLIDAVKEIANRSDL